MKYSEFRLDSGVFTGRRFGASNIKLLKIPAGAGLVPGEFDPKTQRVDVDALKDGDGPSGFVIAYAPPRDVQSETRQRRRMARQRIDRLERAQRRPVRELLIDPNNAAAKQRLAEIDDEIASLRSDLQQSGSAG